MRLILTLLLLPTLGGYQPPESPRFITDDQGRALILHGLNVANTCKYPPYLPWQTREDIERMADDWGFNLARLLVSWAAIEPEMGVFDDAYLDQVAERVDWFAAAGIYVILDMHQDVYGPVDSDGRELFGNGHPAWAYLSDGQPFQLNTLSWFLNYWQPAVMRGFDNLWDYRGHPELQDHYALTLARLAQRFRDHPAVLGYDIMNEPWAGTLIDDPESFDSGPYRAFLERMIAAIRAVDEDGWIFFEPRAWGPNYGDPSYIGVLDDPREGEERLVYFPHYYSVNVDIFQKYDPESDTSIRDWAESRKLEIDAQRAPMLIGEWGTDPTWTGALEYLQEAARMADSMTSGWAYWSYELGGWSPVDGNRDESPIADILVRAYPQRVAGQPIYIDYDPDARRLSLGFEQKQGVTGPTEIYIPADRFFPEGFDLSVSDAEGTWSSQWDANRELLSIWTNPEEPVHWVEVPEPGAAARLATVLLALSLLGRMAGRR
jgi:endoglycosylceramidase